MSATTSVNDATGADPQQIPEADQPNLAELAKLYAGVVMLGNGMIL